LNDKYKSFCDDVDKERPKDGTVNWKVEKPYYEKTPDEFQFKIQLKNGAKDFNKQQCVESLDRIINSCDASNNPMNWKYGGSWTRGSYVYEINPKKDREYLTKPWGSCGGWYKFLWGSYDLYGKGWANNDFGEKLKQSAKDCVGGGITAWDFEYYDKPSDHDGWEWHVFFRTPIWVRRRCFDNLKVQHGAGGYTNHWKDKFSDQRYEDDGCEGSD
jgi:hypothetical protein